MKRFQDRFDAKYLKISAYAVVSALIIFALGMLLYHSGGFFGRLWALFTAVLKPIVYGGMISYLLTPPVRAIQKWLTKLKMRESFAEKLAVLLALLLIAAIIIILLVLLFVAVYRKISGINFAQLKNLLLSAQVDISSFSEMLKEKLSEYGVTLGSIGNRLTDVVDNVKSFFSTALFAVIFAIYFLLDGQRIGAYWGKVFRTVAGEKNQERLRLLRSDARRVFSGYLRGQVVDAAIVGVLVSAVMLAAGVPYAIVVGMLTGLGNLIPYVGTLVGYLSVILVCVAEGELKKLVIGVVCLTLVMLIDSQMINPRLLSSNIQIHPLLVVAALIAGSAIGGFAGMLIAVPVAALLKVQLDRYIESKNEETRTDENIGEEQ